MTFLLLEGFRLLETIQKIKGTPFAELKNVRKKSHCTEKLKRWGSLLFPSFAILSYAQQYATRYLD